MGKRKLDMESAEAYGAFMRADWPPGQDPMGNRVATKRARTRKEAVVVETPEELRREGFLSVAAGLEAMRNKKRPTSDEAIFLGLCRNMAVHAGRGNLDAVRRACREVGYEFGGARSEEGLMGRCACGHEELRGGKLVSMQLADEPALRGRFVMIWRDSGSRLVAKLTGTRVDGLYRRLRYVLYDGPGRGTLMESRYDPEQEVKAFRTRKAAEAEKARVERVERKAARAWKKEGKA